MAFSQERAGSDTEMCVVSAEGLIGTVALHQAGSIVVFEVVFRSILIRIHSITMYLIMKNCFVCTVLIGRDLKSDAMCVYLMCIYMFLT